MTLTVLAENLAEAADSCRSCPALLALNANKCRKMADSGRWAVYGAKWTSVLYQIWLLLQVQKQCISQTIQFLSPFLYSNLPLLKSTVIRAAHLCYTDADCPNHSDFKSNHSCKTRILTWTNHTECFQDNFFLTPETTVFSVHVVQQNVVTHCLIQDFL